MDPKVSQKSVKVAGGYVVNSLTGMDIELEACGLASGAMLQVANKAGEVIYDGVRAFLYLNDKMNLVRFADKVWMLVYTKKPKKVRLQKVNLFFGEVRLLFDERGKLHRDQVSPYYRNIQA